MYDSDEVRDTVRRDARRYYAQRSWAIVAGADAPGLTAAEQATVDNALPAEGNPGQQALRAYLHDVEARQREREKWTARLRAALDAARAFLEWARRIADAFADTMRAAFERLSAAARAVVEALGLVAEPEPFAWQRRPRRPEVKPARMMDAVAAGRQPAAVMRTQIRRGRR